MGITSGSSKSQIEDTLSSIYPLLGVAEEDDLYTNDGTVDFRNNPSNKRKTGSWKACSYILGTYVVQLLLVDQ